MKSLKKSVLKKKWVFSLESSQTMFIFKGKPWDHESLWNLAVRLEVKGDNVKY